MKPRNNKILTIVNGLKKGGVHRTAQFFAQGYQNLGMDSRLLALQMGGVREKYLSDSGIPYWLFLTEKNLAEIEEWNPHFIHLHSHGFNENEYKNFSPLFKDRLVFEKNIFSIPNPWSREMNVSCQMSIWCDWRFRRHKASKEIKTAIVPNAATPEAFQQAKETEVEVFKKRHGIPLDALVIGRIGQSDAGKWSVLLIDIFEKLCDSTNSKIHLLLVNPPKLIVEKITESHIANCVVIIDEILGDENLSIAYSSMDIFLLVAEHGESFGNVLTESMLCQTPVVALSTPWANNSQCEVVGHMQGGLIATTPDGLYRAVKELVSNKYLREMLGKQGREKVIKEYDYVNVAKMAIEAVKSNHSIIPKSELRKRVLEIYRDAFDQPSQLTMEFMKHEKLLPLTRYTTGYESISKFPGQVFKIISRSFKKSKNLVFY